MGADLIITSAFARKDQELDFDAALALVPSLTDDELNDFLDSECGEVMDIQDGYDDANAAQRADARHAVVGAINSLARVFKDDDRSFVTIDTPDGWRVFILGGTSWGDSPSDAFDHMNNLWAIPLLMEAIGFWIGRNA